MAEPAPLQLLAEDQDDLAVISAALQDAVAKVGDISYEAKARRLTIAFNRFRWEAGSRQRVRAALQVGGVLAVQARRIRRDRRDAVVELLAIGFEPGEPPGGTLTLSFAGGGDLRADVECLDAVLADLSQPWPTPREPSHEA
ncbi:DUF2948 family protein [Phenylobacterium sp.]|jgi:hypothetical protein|uniref:DUF2948 family protein n=1 Tax=Phenylobacterium sp. TaxID=1871053 RepID=UPI002EDAA026